MKIGLLIDTFNRGGAETMVYETAKLLKSSGHTPVLLHFGSAVIEGFAQGLNIEHHVIPHHKLYKKSLLLPLFILKTRTFLRSLKLDVLHSHLFSPIYTFAIITKLIRLKHVGTLHDIYMIEDKPSRIRFIKLASLLDTKLIAVSTQMRRFYLERSKLEQSKITFIPNFTDENTFGKDRDAIRKELGMSDQDFLIISVGRLVKLKRFDLLIKAIALSESNQTIKAAIVGDGEERQALEELIIQYGVEKKISLFGERHDVPRLLAAADLFTLTSESEGMSKSILEAMAAALPIVATDVGGNSDLVEKGKNGYLISPSPQALRDKLNSLNRNLELRQRMGLVSKERIENEYSAKNFLALHLNLYR